MAEDNIQIGDKMTDGTIYAGISPDTKEAMYVTAKDAGLITTFNQAKKCASKLDAHGHKDWRLPTEAELNVLFKNREKGALKGAFNLKSENGAGYYWSSKRAYIILGSGLSFSDGQYYYIRNALTSVRCVR